MKTNNDYFLKLCEDYIYAVFLCMVTENSKDADNYRIAIHLKILDYLKRAKYKIDEALIEKMLHNLDKCIGLPTLHRGDDIEEHLVRTYGKKLHDKILELLK